LSNKTNRKETGETRRQYHFGGLLQRVVFLLLVALGAIEPLLAARRADRGLNVQDVLAPAPKNTICQNN
jgi:hypothetical protein